MTDLRYGPASDPVQAVLDRYGEDPAAVWDRVRPWSDWDRSDAAYRMLKRPRDYAWDRFHDGIRAQDLTEAFELLWSDLRALRGGLPPLPVADAVCVQLLGPHLDSGPFSRSRLYVEVASHPPFHPDFWPTVTRCWARGRMGTDRSSARRPSPRSVADDTVDVGRGGADD